MTCLFRPEVDHVYPIVFRLIRHCPDLLYHTMRTNYNFCANERVLPTDELGTLPRTKVVDGKEMDVLASELRQRFLSAEERKKRSSSVLKVGWPGEKEGACVCACVCMCLCLCVVSVWVLCSRFLLDESSFVSGVTRVCAFDAAAFRAVDSCRGQRCGCCPPTCFVP